MPTDVAIVRQISLACIVPLLDASDDPITGSAAIDSLGTPIPFDYIGSAGPGWPAASGAASTEFVEVTVANGVVVQYPKVTTAVDGATGTVKPGGAGAASSHKLSFATLEWGKTRASTIPDMQGQLVLCVIPIGENVTTAENGFYYILGKISNEIAYDEGGETVVSVTIEVTGTSATATTAGNTALAWAPPAITPVGAAVAVTPVPLVSGDLTRLKAGLIVVK
jgi:hypothetical protein